LNGKKKSVLDIVSEAHEEIVELAPTNEEIQAYADLLEKENRDYGVVTYSKSKGNQSYFIHFHDTWKKKFGGRIHIDVGFVDEEYRDEKNVPDTTHLMLDKNHALEFIAFIKQKRNLRKNG